MCSEETFELVPDLATAQAAAERLFRAAQLRLISLMPRNAEILHVGATAIPRCLTKGDVDIVVRVDPSDFAAAEAALTATFSRNVGSPSTPDFAAFEDKESVLQLGIQLTAKDGPLDIFHQFAGALRDDPELLRRYNALKQAYQGRPMNSYRAAKEAFILSVLASHRR